MQSSIIPISRLPSVGTTIFATIAELAQRHNAINLAQGAPDFDCDPVLVDYACKAMRDGLNQYAPMIGVQALRAAIVHKVNVLYHCDYDVETEVTITNSASEGLYAAITALLHPGDEVIYFEPSFDSYGPSVRLQGAIPVSIKLPSPSFKIDWQEVEAKINAKTRMIIINSPHNPSGSILNQQDIDALIRLTDNTNIIILSDEVYEHVVFDHEHHSMSAHPKLAERSVIIGSFGKSFNVTGWRIGHCLAPEALSVEIRKIHQYLTFSADTPAQHALAEYMQNPQTYLGQAELYQKKRDLLIRCLANSRLKLLPCDGAFFILADYSAISDMSDTDFVQYLITEFGVATVPVSSFYTDATDNKYIRLSFAKRDQVIIDAAAKLCMA